MIETVEQPTMSDRELPEEAVRCPPRIERQVLFLGFKHDREQARTSAERPHVYLKCWST